MTSYRCCYMIKNSINNINNKRKCKNRYCFIIENTKLCKIHTKLLYNNYVIFIQKNYRGYMCRNKLKNIYNKLPRDLQEHILYFVRQDLSYKRYKNIIFNYFKNKYNNLKYLMDINSLYLITREDIYPLDSIYLLYYNTINILDNYFKTHIVDYPIIIKMYYYIYDLRLNHWMENLDNKKRIMMEEIFNIYINKCYMLYII